MILPIIGYGHPTLRRRAEAITPDYPGLEALIANMFETMYNAQGVGLAAPQINLSIRLFVVDGSPLQDDDQNKESMADFKKVFINAQKLEETGEPWPYAEGCLSIPDIREDVRRPERLRIQYLDEHFQPHDEVFTGMKARIIQHEYDHIEGVLFLDHVSPLRRQVLKSRLGKISKGLVPADYPMRFAGK